jgi:predicted enzyme related to lactoylglutathione lyase
MKVLGVDNVFVPVDDLARAVEFYHDIVGLPVAKRFDDIGMVLFQIGDETPGLGVGVANAPRGAGQKLWLEVTDARAAAEELASRGLITLAPPFAIPTGWAFEVQDPWGNVIGFTDYTTRPDLGRAHA